ncbi:MAG: copper homeostasis protein CutC [Actinomycetaceae bacterium]|nr:copper homeostasis protein CutC [Actinomycetaceae bacterium]
MTVIEVCVEDLAGIASAYQAGADRVELCVRLEVGGLTPPDELINGALDMITGFPTPFALRILVREYYESFIHTPQLQADLVQEVARLRTKYAHTSVPVGFVVGALDENGAVPVDFLEKMVAAAQGWTLVFHRGIDACVNRTEALERLVAAGFNAVLTAGGHASVANCAQMHEDISQTAGKLTIIASGGVRAHNAAQILRETGASEIHFRAPYADGRAGTDPQNVAQIVAAIRGM